MMKEEYNKKQHKSKHIGLEELVKIEVGIAIGYSIRNVAGG